MSTPDNNTPNKPSDDTADGSHTVTADSSRPSGWQSFLREWRGFFIFLAVMLIFRSIIADWNHVPSGSMRPNILIGDRVVVNKLAFDLRVPFTFIRLAHFGDPERGDIITFESPKDGRLLIKRVIGIPGDTVELRSNRLYLNNAAANYAELSEDEVNALDLPDANLFRIMQETTPDHSRVMMVLDRRPSPFSNYRRSVVPPGQYFVMGDNRDRSGDSRVIGLVDRAAILGRAFAVAFSLDYDDHYLPRGSRFFQSLVPED